MAIDLVRYTIGVDLGKQRNHTAMAVMKREWHQATVQEFIASGTQGYQGEYRYTLVGADRLALGTPYPMVVQWVKSIAEPLGAELGSIVVDATGLGSAVMDEFRKVRMPVRVQGIVITGDQAVGGLGGTTSAGFRTVSRTELLTKLQLMIQNKAFQVDRPRCREWEALRKELSLLRLDRKGPGQDDLALALALAIWWGMRL